MLKRIHSDSGLMGPTHALSALSLALLFTWLASDIMFGKILGTNNLSVYIAALIIIIGASLMPDLDAVNSTSINVLGIVGSVLSTAMRAFSSFIQATIKGPADKSGDPHRGFWHTFLSAFFIGFLISILTNIKLPLFKIKDIQFTVASILIIFIIYISIQLTLASLFKKLYNKQKNNMSTKIIVTSVSLLFSVYLVIFLPTDINYTWVGGTVTFGWILHLLGDMLTVMGVPILFPLKRKGKRWWNYRFPLGIKAGGFVEKTLLIPLFSIIALISIVKIVPLLI